MTPKTGFLLWVLALGTVALVAQIQPIRPKFSEESIDVFEDVVYKVHHNSSPPLQKLTTLLGPNWEEIITSELKADIYSPPLENAKYLPLIIYVHRGIDWTDSHEDVSAHHFCMWMARCGFVVASIDYRHAFFGIQKGIRPYVYAIQDINSAIAYFIDHADDYKINPRAVFLAGESMGAAAVLHAAFWKNTATQGVLNHQGIDEDYGSLGNPQLDYSGFKPLGIISIGGAVLDLNMIDGSIPILSIHGTLDPIIRFGYGQPRTAFDQTLQRSWRKIKALMAFGRDPAMISDRLPLYGSKLIHDKLEDIDPQSRLVAMYGERDHLITSKSNDHNLRTSAISIFKATQQFAYQLCRDSTRIEGPSKPVIGKVCTYTSTLPGIKFQWKLSENGEILGKKDSRSIQVRWNIPADSSEVKLVAFNSMGFDSPETSLQVQVMEAPSNPSLGNSNSQFLMVVTIIAALCAGYFLAFIVRKKSKRSYA